VADVLHRVAATRVNRRGRVVLLQMFARALAARIPRACSHCGGATAPTNARKLLQGQSPALWDERGQVFPFAPDLY
jgi:hypothetical protein